MKFNFSLTSKIFIVLLLLLSSCYGPPNLVSVKQEIINYYENGGYADEMSSVVESAKSELSGIKFNKNTTIVFDVDETVLSNFEVMKKDNFCYDKEEWDNWISEIRCKAVPHMLSLYKFVLAKKGKIVFLTGRRDTQQEATAINLRAEGFLNYDTLITRNPDEYDLTALKYKSKVRQELEKKGYQIQATIGDQQSDLEGIYNGKVQIKIPNYIYKID